MLSSTFSSVLISVQINKQLDNFQSNGALEREIPFGHEQKGNPSGRDLNYINLTHV